MIIKVNKYPAQETKPEMSRSHTPGYHFPIFAYSLTLTKISSEWWGRPVAWGGDVQAPNSNSLRHAGDLWLWEGVGVTEPSIIITCANEATRMKRPLKRPKHARDGSGTMSSPDGIVVCGHGITRQPDAGETLGRHVTNVPPSAQIRRRWAAHLPFALSP